ncbi:MAG: preprotein translocase subunit SecY [Akkermansiaceae bacterium]
MISAFTNTWKIPELRDRLLFTMAMIVIVRLGVHIPLPGVNMDVIRDYVEYVKQQNADGAGGGVGAILNVFSGGGLTSMGLFALGIMPYISASIMMQLLSAVVPKLARLKKEDGGQQKINQWTRFVTIAIAAVQGYFLAQSLDNPGSNPLLSGIDKVTQNQDLVPAFGAWFVIQTVLIIVAGTLLLMWIGDQITERGIGNGVSLIISVNIISSLPGVIVQIWNTFVIERGADNPFAPLLIVLMVVLFLFVIAAVITITQGQRRIAVQYARRVAGRREMSGGTQYLPLKVNYAGVMPVIFATAILQLPTQLLGQITDAGWVLTIRDILSPNEPWFYLLSGFMIFFFSFFWVATMFQPSEVAENLKRGGGYIPGVRPGKPTSDFLDYTMTRLTFAGALFLTLIFMMPFVSGLALGLTPNSLITSFFGGTSLLILVGVLLDMMRQIETHLLQRQYDGFLRKGKIKGRQQRQLSGQQASSSSVLYLWVVLAVIVLIAIVAFFING